MACTVMLPCPPRCSVHLSLTAAPAGGLLWACMPLVLASSRLQAEVTVCERRQGLKQTYRRPNALPAQGCWEQPPPLLLLEVGHAQIWGWMPW